MERLVLIIQYVHHGRRFLMAISTSTTLLIPSSLQGKPREQGLQGKPREQGKIRASKGAFNKRQIRAELRAKHLARIPEFEGEAQLGLENAKVKRDFIIRNHDVFEKILDPKAKLSCYIFYTGNDPSIDGTDFASFLSNQSAQTFDKKGNP
jgi:hypothetical protein